MIWSTAIDGAVPAHNMRIEGDNIIIDNKMDSEYKYAILTDELNADDCDGLIIMVSKDGKNFCIALAVEIDGKSLTTVELCIRMCPGWFRNELQKQILQSTNQEEQNDSD